MDHLNRYLDAAVLKPETTREEAQEAIKACIRLKTFSVCVRPCDIELAQSLCRGTETKVCVVLGFPHGDQLSASKADEARHYIESGVDEIDMVANYGWAKSGDWDAVRADIAGVARQCKAANVLLKVIFETAQLTAGQIQRLAEISIDAGADYIKTSTGFNGAGAKESDVQVMLETAAGKAKVKPSGGIRDAATARRFIEMGASRLGVGWTSCAAICEGGEVSGSGY
ncbi:deoxyribose-phosphate aldolase [Coraliomargarita sinensis]|uniref:Deoxyribose-phosphate aldolase n=1 Tax=Coraliomargarita sinensis TaxID=2174842 RepID=A0A317ZI83_9BACT|nr:deoxyribose-phosphate aldolase [Coraliomargarita sinensis]PXA03923.1 deoxyribose-phosphate aldolase [Coraliomargarita sinensis]